MAYYLPELRQIQQSKPPRQKACEMSQQLVQ